MDPFESLVSEFAGKAGLALQSGKDGSVDLVVDGVDVSVQYRPDRGDVVVICIGSFVRWRRGSWAGRLTKGNAAE